MYEAYQSRTATQLAEIIEELWQALRNLNTSQTHGSLSWQRSREGLKNELQMATRVYKEKTGQPPVQNHALVDLSEVSSTNGYNCGVDPYIP